MLVLHRTALRRRTLRPNLLKAHHIARIHLTPRHEQQEQPSKDPRLSSGGNVVQDAFANIRDDYKAPKYPIVLAHGLFGFDELHPAGGLLGGVQYWSGIEEALAAKGVEVVTATVPPSGRVEVRAQRLAEDIEKKAGGKAVNIIA